MSVAITHRKTCRLCDSPDCELVLPLAPSAIADAFVTRDQLGTPQETYPLDVYMCRACGHVQLLDVLDPEALFANYIYTSTTSPGLIDHFRRYAQELEQRAQPASGALAVDIGSNDGSLLSILKESGMQVLGVDPAREIARQATERGVPTIASFFDAGVARDIRADHGPATIVTANNVFAHADNLAGIADGVRDVLAPDGIFAFEVSYLLDTLRNMVFDYVYHEHLCYHAVRPMRSFLERHGMELFDVQRIPTKGGSIRGFAQLKGGPQPTSDNVAALIAEEDAAGLDSPATFRDFGARVGERRDETRALLEKATADGGTVAGFGASATGTTLTYHFGLDDFVKVIVDDNDARQGRFSPGHHIPVLSPSALYEQSFSHVVVLAWRFAEPIMKSHARFLDGGGTFVVPLPEVRTFTA